MFIDYRFSVHNNDEENQRISTMSTKNKEILNFSQFLVLLQTHNNNSQYEQNIHAFYKIKYKKVRRDALDDIYKLFDLRWCKECK